VAENVQLSEDGYSAPAGQLTINYENEDSVRHTLLIEDIDEDQFKLETEGGESDSGTIELEAGDYEMYCDVPGHASMRATLTVE
jgi:plastocyanin